MYTIEEIMDFKEFKGYTYSRDKKGRILKSDIPSSIKEAEIFVIDSLFTHQTVEDVRKLTDEVLDAYRTMCNLINQKMLAVEIDTYVIDEITKITIEIKSEVVENEVVRICEAYSLLVELVNKIQFMSDEDKYRALLEYTSQFNTYLYIHKTIRNMMNNYGIVDEIDDNLYLSVASKVLIKNLSDAYKIVNKIDKLQIDLSKFYDSIDEELINLNMKKRVEIASQYYILDEYCEYLLSEYKV